MAICKIFHKYCKENNITLHDGNFTLSYDTNIPRQVDLNIAKVYLPLDGSIFGFMSH